jgi:hypothetical protein
VSGGFASHAVAIFFVPDHPVDRDTAANLTEGVKQSSLADAKIYLGGTARSLRYRAVKSIA